ncbi:MAG TPA: MFS transporter [Castellaniella sp.]|nr:MFS transporter [Castellaniella sp.]
MNKETALWLQGLILLMLMAASSAPTPLYGIYRDSWGFSAITLTIVFGVYAASLLLALLILGSASDHIGRRPVIVGALLLDAASMWIFLSATAVPALIAARLLQGLATGAATSALAAGLVDLDRRRSPLVNSVAPMLGLALGALGASLLVQFAPAPMQLTYAVLIVILTALALVACFLPETAGRRPGLLAAMRPIITVPAGAWRVLWLIAPIDIAAWALGGFYLSLGPTLTRQISGMDAPVMGGVMVFALTVSAAITTLILRSWPPQRMVRFSATTLMSGIGLTLASVYMASGFLLFVGTVVAGTGFGLGFLGALRSLLPVAQAHERAGLMAAFYILSYLSFSVPVIIAGILVNVMGLAAASYWYGGGLMFLAAAALIGSHAHSLRYLMGKPCSKRS